MTAAAQCDAYDVHMHPHGRLEAAARACLDDVDAMALRYRAEVRALPGYLPATISDDELDRSARAVLELMLRQLSGEDVASALAERSAAIGRHRARQGLPLDSLLRAVRMDFRFLWESLTAVVAPEQAHEFTSDVVTLWDTVESHSNHVQAAYTEELMSLRRETELERGYLVRQLLVTGIDDQRQREATARTLGVAATEDLVLVVSRPDHSRAFRNGVEALQAGLPVHSSDGYELTIVHPPQLGRTGWQRLLRLPAGISPRAGDLGQLPGLWPVARKLAQLARPEHAALMDEHWPELLSEDLGPAVAALGADRLDTVLELPTHARTTLLRTAREYLSTGSISGTAETLFCHRNTILKRLHRFQSMTGLDITVPEQAALAHVLMSTPNVRDEGRES